MHRTYPPSTRQQRCLHLATLPGSGRVPMAGAGLLLLHPWPVASRTKHIHAKSALTLRVSCFPPYAIATRRAAPTSPTTSTQQVRWARGGLGWALTRAAMCVTRVGLVRQPTGSRPRRRLPISGRAAVRCCNKRDTPWVGVLGNWLDSECALYVTTAGSNALYGRTLRFRWPRRPRRALHPSLP